MLGGALPPSMLGGALPPSVPQAHALLPGMGQPVPFGHAGPGVTGQLLGLFQGDNARASQLREQEARHELQLRIIGLLSQGGQRGFF